MTIPLDPAQQHLDPVTRCAGVPQAAVSPIHPGSLGDTFHSPSNIQNHSSSDRSEQFGSVLGLVHIGGNN